MNVYSRVPCCNLKKDIEHSEINTIGPFRFNVDFSRKLNTGMFFMGEVDEKTPPENLKNAYAHKILWDLFMSIMKTIYSSTVNIGGRNESILKKILFRFIPIEGVSYSDLLNEFDPSTPMDFNYSKIKGYELYLLVNDKDVEEGQIRGLINQSFNSMIENNNRIIHSIIYSEIEPPFDADGEEGEKPKSKKRKMDTIPKYEIDLGRRIKEHVNFIRENYDLNAHPDSSMKGFKSPFNLQGKSHSWSYVLQDIHDLKNIMSMCFKQPFEELFESLMDSDDDPTSGLCFYNLFNPRSLNSPLLDLVKTDQPEDYMEVNADGNFVFYKRNEDVDIMWIEISTSSSVVTNLTYMMCPYFFQHEEDNTNTMPFYLIPQHQETVSGDSVNKWSWPDRYEKHMLKKSKNNRFPVFSEDYIKIGTIDGETLCTDSTDIAVESVEVDGVGSLWQWKDRIVRGVESYKEETYGYIHQLWFFTNGSYLLRTYEPHLESYISKRFVKTDTHSPLVEFPAKKIMITESCIVLLPRSECRNMVVSKSIRSNFLVAWNSGNGMAGSLLTSVKEMNARFMLNKTQIECPWFEKRHHNEHDMMDDDDMVSLPSSGSLYKYNLDPMSNYIIFLVNIFENYMDVQDHHSAMLHMFFTCMNTHKGSIRRPHLIIWGGPAVSKSFLMNLATDISCPGTIVSRSHVSDQYIFGDAENRDTTNANRVYVVDEAKPSDLGIYTGDAANQHRISMLKERLSKHFLLSQVLVTDKQTGARMSMTYDRSNENVHVFNTNFYPRTTDSALDSRFLRRHVPQIIRIDKRPKTQAPDPIAYTKMAHFFQGFDYIRIQYEMLMYVHEVEPPYLYVFETLMTEFIERIIKDYPLAINLRQDTRLKENARSLAIKMVTSFAVFQSVYHKKSTFFSTSKITSELFMEIEKFMVFPSTMFPFVMDMTGDQYFNPMWLTTLSSIANNGIYFKTSCDYKEHFNYGNETSEKSITNLPWLWKETNEVIGTSKSGMRPKSSPVEIMETEDSESHDDKTESEKNLEKRYQRYVVIEQVTSWNKVDSILYNAAAKKISQSLQSDKNAPSIEYIVNALTDLSEHQIIDPEDPEKIKHDVVMICSASFSGSSQPKNMLCISKGALTLARKNNQNIQSVLKDMRHMYSLPSNYLMCRPCEIKFKDEKREVPQFLDVITVPYHQETCSLMDSDEYKTRLKNLEDSRRINNGFTLDIDMECLKDIENFQDSNGNIYKCDCFRSRKPVRVKGRAIDKEECEDMKNRLGFCPEFENLEIMCEDASIDDKAFEDYFTKHLGYTHSEIYGRNGLVNTYHPIKSSLFWLDHECDGFDDNYPEVSLEKWKKRMCIKTDLRKSASSTQELQPSLMSKSLHNKTENASTSKPISTMFDTRQEHTDFVRRLLKGRSISEVNVKNIRSECKDMEGISEEVRRIITSRDMSSPLDIINWMRCYID